MSIPRSNEKYEQILKAGLSLFSKNGFSKTTIKDIAKEAGVSFGTVFTYFESKQKLFAECVNVSVKDFRKNLIKTPYKTGVLTLENLESLVESQLNYILIKERELRLIQYILGLPDQFSEMDQLNKLANDFIFFIEEIVVEGMKGGFLPKSNPLSVGQGYLAFLIGIRLTFTDDAQIVHTDTFKQQALRLFGIIH